MLRPAKRGPEPRQSDAPQGNLVLVKVKKEKGRVARWGLTTALSQNRTGNHGRASISTVAMTGRG